MSVKIVIVITKINSEGTDWTYEQGEKIHEWFTLQTFEIQFLPAVGMMIDLDDFFDCEEISNEINTGLGYVTIDKILIGKYDITLFCS